MGCKQEICTPQECASLRHPVRGAELRWRSLLSPLAAARRFGSVILFLEATQLKTVRTVIVALWSDPGVVKA